MIGQLLAQPQRYQLAQALRLLLQWLRREGIPCDMALQLVLRFRNSISLGFPPSDIEALRCDPALAEGRPLGAPLPQIELTAACIGLLGMHGVLPYHYTERIAAHVAGSRDGCAGAFLDTFSSRLVALHYQGWGKYRLEHGLDVSGKDTLLPMLMALSGNGARRLGAGVAGDTAAFYTGLLRQRPLSAPALALVLQDYLGVPLRVQQFAGAWQAIAPALQSRLGSTGARLGHSGVLGVRRWRHGHCLRLWIGPLDRDGFARFLPGASGALALENMLALLGVACARCEAQLILQAGCAGPVLLSAQGRQRLGWDTFLPSPAPRADQADVRYALHPA